MTNYLSLPIGDRAPDEVNAVIEIPRGTTNKYEYDKQLNVFRLDRNLHSPVHYPGDYGFIPSTLSLDGDPLDVLVLVDAPSFSGCLMSVRPVGVLGMIDQGKEDEKVLAVGTNNPLFSEIRDYGQLYPHLLLEIEHFFTMYKELEAKTTKIIGWENADRARAIVVECKERFAERAAGKSGRSQTKQS
ncbi:MAG TPA: inorganic diphosphatase [Pyrinomonadaceae bacterium]|nr:inorganic diphosphatase [Pyrinomonadaceae bacterium]